MGTRHLIAVQIDGQYKVAQYGQWDGSPGSQGADILAFLRDNDLTQFAEKVRATRFLDHRECKAIEAESNWPAKYPWLSRDAGSDILGYVKDQPDGLALLNKLSFAGDSLFCEWAYVIDFDAATFEVFEGFNRTPLEDGERFKNVPTDNAHRDEPYHPVKLRAKWPLDELPTEEAFLDELTEKEEV